MLDQAPNQPISAAYWAIQEGIEPGFAGTIVASGTSAATATPTGGSAFDLDEYTIEVQGLSVTTNESANRNVVPRIPFALCKCIGSASPFAYDNTDFHIVLTAFHFEFHTVPRLPVGNQTRKRCKIRDGLSIEL